MSTIATLLSFTSQKYFPMASYAFPAQSTYYMEGNTGHQVFQTQFGESNQEHQI